MGASPPQLSRPVRTAVASSTLFLLSSSIFLTLFILLIPNSRTHLSMFSIQPVNKRYASVQPTSTRNAVELSHLNLTEVEGMQSTGGSIRPADGIALREDADQVWTDIGPKPLDRTTPPWLGTEGPSIWVGAMLICSKNGQLADVVCTSASQGGFHAAFLPLSLSDTLVYLPDAPPTPILLLVGGVSALIASLVYLYGLLYPAFVRGIGRSRILNLFCPSPSLDKFTRPRSTASVESMVTLVNQPATLKDTRSDSNKHRIIPHLAFCFSGVIALGLFVACTALELVAVRDAEKRWNEEEANQVGLEFRYGVMAYLLPCLPVVMFLTLIITYIPAFLAPFRKRPADGFEEIETFTINPPELSTAKGGKISTPLHIETITSVPSAWTRADIDPPAPVKRIKEADRERQRVSVRRSWRNTFGSVIGVAV